MLTWKLRFSLVLFNMIVVALITPHIAFANEISEIYEAEVKGYHISLGFLTEVKVGENAVHVKILDPHGQPVAVSEVEIMLARAEQNEHEENDSHREPAAESASDHGSTPGMNNDTNSATENTHESETETHEEIVMLTLEREVESGEYEGILNFEGSGEWVIFVHFTVEDELLEVEFPVSVAGAISKNFVLAGFLGVNVAIVSSAALLKRNKTKKSL